MKRKPPTIHDLKKDPIKKAKVVRQFSNSFKKKYLDENVVNIVTTNSSIDTPIETARTG